MVEQVPDNLESAAPQLILIVDDELRMRRFIRMNMELEGYQVIEAENGIHALDQIRQFTPDLVVMDVMMPEMDGFETLKLLREISTVPVILLTVRDDEEDITRGLALGADDYITKPFSPREVVARVKAVVRRARGPQAQAQTVRLGKVEMDPMTRRCTVDGRLVDLTATEFDLLFYLMTHPGQIFSRDQLLSEVWGYAAMVNTRTVDVHVAQLRGKLGENNIIRTVRGVGYGAEVSESGHDAQ